MLDADHSEVGVSTETTLADYTLSFFLVDLADDELPPGEIPAPSTDCLRRLSNSR